MKSFECLVFALVLLVYMLISRFIEQKQSMYLHCSTIAVLLGLVLGLMNLWVSLSHHNNILNTKHDNLIITFKTEHKFEIDNGIFFEMLLPLIIMGAAREVDLKLLCNNWSYIVLYGVVGTFVNFVGLFCFLFVFKGRQLTRNNK